MARSDRFEAAAALLAFVELYRFENNVPRLYGMMAYFSAAQERLHQAITSARELELVKIGEGLSLEQAFDLATG